MGLENRPYIGSWKANSLGLVQHSPDALVYVNGDVAIPGCSKCSGKINIQRYVTEVSVENGVDAGAASASISLSIPTHDSASFSRDADHILRPGLEVQIYMRGYFAVEGLYGNLAEPRVEGDITTDVGGSGSVIGNPEIPPVVGKGRASQFSNLTPDTLSSLDLSGVDQGFLDKWYKRGFTKGLVGDEYNQSVLLMGTAEVIESYWRTKGGDFSNASVHVGSHNDLHSGNHSHGGAMDFYVQYGSGQRVPALQVAASMQNLKAEGRIPNGGLGVYLNVSDGGLTGTAVEQAGKASSSKAGPGGSAGTHYDLRGYGYTHPATGNTKGVDWLRLDVDGDGKDEYRTDSGGAGELKRWLDSVGLADVYEYYKGNVRDPWLPTVDDRVPNLNQILNFAPYEVVKPTTPGFVEATSEEEDSEKVGEAVRAGPSLLEEAGLSGLGIEDLAAYPYYPVFHGVVTAVTSSWSGGVQTFSLTCGSMLHFWEYANMSTNASVFGNRPVNSKMKMSLVGNNFTGMHPYQIIYTLFHDIMGAAHGVAWALSSKTNQDAVSDFDGESLYSLTLKYWEKRFSQRMTKLRMHGATGSLFSSMASAWLARTNASTIMRLMRERYNERKPRDVVGLLEEAEMVGLFNRNRRKAMEARKNAELTEEQKALVDSEEAADALEFASGTGGSDSPSFDVNVVEMQAFTLDLGSIGQLNLFESTYQSKSDIARTVCEVTGFEFYQDVDGDFVFKPPMWNLDTSSSRVYRIEDIDIISLGLDSNEPQATYVTAKNSYFKNLQGHGLENEWGVMGQYIDYRLVAKYGWRPGSLEYSVYNDPKALFFAAVNRLDVLNVGVEAARVTIPIRPEIRAGYPVYIPYLDCFFYVNSLSHSHPVGGQCSTTLQLVAKRSKFYAPGRSSDSEGIGVSAIDNIDLSNLLLPPRPLVVRGESGVPRLSGFPNVVMALDPSAVNPMFFVVGSEFDDLGNPQVVRNLLRVGVDNKWLTELGDSRGSTLYQYTAADEHGDPVNVRFFFSEDDQDGSGLLPKDMADLGEGEAFNIVESAKLFSDSKADSLNRVGEIRDEVDKLRGSSVAIEARLALTQAGDLRDTNQARAFVEDLATQKEQINSQISQLLQEADQVRLKAQGNWKTSADPKMQGVAFLLDMIEKMGQKYRAEIGYKSVDGQTSSVNLLDMLSDKKAVFTNGSLPGSYRYYSCSHPDPAHQGPAQLRFDKNVVKTLGPAPIDGIPPKVSQYTRNGGDELLDESPFEARLIEGVPEVGIRVLTANPKDPKEGKSISTSDVMELMFTPHPVTARTAKTAVKPKSLSSGASLQRAAKAKLASFSPSPTSTLSESFGPFWSELQSALSVAIEQARTVAEANGRAVGDVVIPDIPSSVTMFGKSWPMSKTFDDIDVLGPTGSKALVPELADAGAESLAKTFARSVEKVRMTIRQTVTSLGGDAEEVATLLGYLDSTLSAKLGAASSPSSRPSVKQTVSKNIERYTSSPVFPVSDDRGYTVVGAYRYGRGVDVNPDGVFRTIHESDVFSMLSKDLKEALLDIFVKRTPDVPLMETVEENGVKVTRPVGQGLAPKAQMQAKQKHLVDEVVKQLQDNGVTNHQILHYMKNLSGDKNPDLLRFSLANVFSDASLDGVQKVPLLNAGVSLADMDLNSTGHVCDCKAAEAQVQLEAFGQVDFVGLDNQGAPHLEAYGSSDSLTRWLAQQAGASSGPWKRQQDAFRGEVLDRSGSHLVPQLGESAAQIDRTVKSAGERVKDLKSLAGKLEDLV